MSRISIARTGNAACLVASKYGVVCSLGAGVDRKASMPTLHLFSVSRYCHVLVCVRYPIQYDNHHRLHFAPCFGMQLDGAKCAACDTEMLTSRKHNMQNMSTSRKQTHTRHRYRNHTGTSIVDAFGQNKSPARCSHPCPSWVAECLRC